MRGHPTLTCMCTSGQQRRRTTLEWCSRWRCVKSKVRGEKGAVEGARDEEEIIQPKGGGGETWRKRPIVKTVLHL